MENKKFSVSRAAMISAVIDALLSITDEEIVIEEKVTYGDAIEKIMKSDTSDLHKSDLVDSVETGKDQDYYKAVIAIVESNIWIFTKIEIIKKLGRF